MHKKRSTQSNGPRRASHLDNSCESKNPLAMVHWAKTTFFRQRQGPKRVLERF